MESYLHKMAKELLYQEIEDKSGFEYKLSNGEGGFEGLILREDYRDECVLMEFPTIEGMYPDELGCTFNGTTQSCDLCLWYNPKTNTCDGVHTPIPYIEGSTCANFENNERCVKTNVNEYRFKTENNTCKCSVCDFFNFKGAVVHDIAVFWKGSVSFCN